MRVILFFLLAFGGQMGHANLETSFVTFLSNFMHEARNNPNFLKNVYKYNKQISIDKNIKEYILSELENNGFKQIDAKAISCVGDYCQYEFENSDGEQSTYTFKFQDDAWYIWLESYNISGLEKVYSLQIDGPKGSNIDVGFNDISPCIEYRNLKNSSVISTNINGLLNKGSNTIHLKNPKNLTGEVKIYISSGKLGDVLVTNKGDVFKWEGVVKDDVTLSFEGVN